MLIEVHIDRNAEDHEKWRQYAESVVQKTLERIDDRITRVEAHLTDENSAAKSGADDKRCLLEAHVEGLPPFAVSHEGGSFKVATDGAAGALKEKLIRTFERLRDSKRG